MVNQEGSTGAAPATTEVVPAPPEEEAPEPRLEAADVPSEPKAQLEAAPAKPLDAPPDLPVVFRGYDRKATDDFLRKLEESFHNISGERDALHKRIDPVLQRRARRSG